MDELITTILLAPSGAGKTTRLQRLQAAGQMFTHIYRDDITTELLRENDIDPRIGLSPEMQRRANEILGESVQQYYVHLRKEMGRQVPHIIIDYPPGNSDEWLYKTIEDSRVYGRRVIVEGITADPAITLRRVLERDSLGIDLDRYALEIMNPNRQNFRSWLITYKNMPDQFVQAALRADESYLFDGNAANQSPKLIAQWAGHEVSIVDKEAYVGFERLALLNIGEASFSATRTGTVIGPHGPMHTFDVRTAGFYDSEIPGRGQIPAAKICRPECDRR